MPLLTAALICKIIETCAAPLFAFLLVEGFQRTSSFEKYLIRVGAVAVASEIPFNLAMGSRIFYPIHQNVLWSFLLSIGLIRWNEKVKEKKTGGNFPPGFLKMKFRKEISQ